jgi:hypothetical protein
MLGLYRDFVPLFCSLEVFIRTGTVISLIRISDIRILNAVKLHGELCSGTLQSDVYYVSVL